MKEAYKIGSYLNTKNTHFKDSELGIKQLIVENVKMNGTLYNVSKKVKFLLKKGLCRVLERKNPKLRSIYIVRNTQK